MSSDRRRRPRCIRRTFHKKRRAGYALVLCMLVAAVSSMAVLGILNTARFETLEANARQRTAIASAAAKGGVEYGVAMLMNNSTLRGTLAPIRIPVGTGPVVSVDIREASGRLTVAASKPPLAAFPRRDRLVLPRTASSSCAEPWSMSLRFNQSDSARHRKRAE